MNPIFLYQAGSLSKKFVSIWNTTLTSAGSSASNEVRLPLIAAGIYNCSVDWGDGSPRENLLGPSNLHVYASTGIYTITITGIINGFQFNDAGDKLKISEVTSWGPLKITTASAFNGCANLLLNAVTDVLDISGTTTINQMFQNCTALTTVGRMNEWSTGHITVLQSVFSGCTNFNQNIGNWNTSNVTAMTSTFSNCTNFNQNLSSWNVRKVTTFQSMFISASNFNNGAAPGISTPFSWELNPAGGISMVTMFNSCTAFNGEISTNAPYWDMSKVTTMSTMLAGASSFNQPIGNWDMSNVTTIASMLSGASSAFKQFLGAWRLTSVAANSMTSFMLNKTAITFPSAYLDDIYNGWINAPLTTPQAISFSTAKQSKASIEGRALLTRAASTKAIVSAVNNGGFIQINAVGHAVVVNNKVFISGVSAGVPSKSYIVTSVDSVDLITINEPYTVNGTGGTLRTGYGYTITDGLLTITTIAASPVTPLIRITTNAHGFPAASTPVLFIYGNTGTGINGTWTVNRIATTTFDLQGSNFGAGGFTNNGNVVFDQPST